MEYYAEYLRSRLRQRKAFPSQIEKAIISAVDRHYAAGKFNVITFIGKECYLCRCEMTPDNKRYSISEFTCYNHTIQDIYVEDLITVEKAQKYDHAYFNNDGMIIFDEFYGETYPELSEYNLHLQKAIANINIPYGGSIFVSGDFTKTNALLYALQSKFGNIIPIEIEDKLNAKSRSIFSREITGTFLNVSKPVKVIDYIGSNLLEMFVPVDKTTLESSFWRDIRWNNIIPENCIECKIADIPCYYLNISFEIDGFNNVFCKVDDKNGHIGYQIINAPWSKIDSLLKNNSVKEGAYNSRIEGRDEVENILPNDGSDRVVDNKRECGRVERTSKENKPKNINGNIDSESNSSISGEKTELIMISEDESLSYIDIFQKYVDGSEEVIIHDSHIYMPHQFNNIRNFILAVNTIMFESGSTNRLKRIKIETQRAQDIMMSRISKNKEREGIEFDENIDLDSIQTKQDEAFEKLRRNLKRNGIELTYSYRKFHDRKIEFSNGWTVEAGRGLDIFKKRVNDMEPLRCKECMFRFTLGGTAKSIKRRVRKTKRL